MMARERFRPTLNTPYTYQFATDSYSVATADFNGDGLPDIVVSNASAKTVSFLLSVKSLTKPTVALTSSAGSALVGSALTFKTAITGGTATATGTVSLLDGSTQLAQQTLDSSASAAFELSNLSAGVHTLALTLRRWQLRRGGVRSTQPIDYRLSACDRDHIANGVCRLCRQLHDHSDRVGRLCREHNL